MGVREGVTANEIKQRHRKLMILNHPDSGKKYDILLSAKEINQTNSNILSFIQFNNRWFHLCSHESKRSQRSSTKNMIKWKFKIGYSILPLIIRNILYRPLQFFFLYYYYHHLCIIINFYVIKNIKSWRKILSSWVHPSSLIFHDSSLKSFPINKLNTHKNNIYIYIY